MSDDEAHGLDDGKMIFILLYGRVQKLSLLPTSVDFAHLAQIPKKSSYHGVSATTSLRIPSSICAPGLPLAGEYLSLYIVCIQ